MAKQILFVVSVAVICSTYLCASAPGGWRKLDLNDDQALEVSRTAVGKLDETSNDLYRGKLLKLKSAQVQVVAGLKYKLVFDLGITNCRKGDDKDIELCDAKDVGRECTVTLWVKPWEEKGNEQLLDGSCTVNSEIPENTDDVEPPKSKPLLGGGDHDFAHYGVFTQFMDKYNKQYESKAEEQRRFLVFQNSMKKAKKLQETEKGSATYGASKFADMTEEEFRQNYLTPTWKVEYDSFLQVAEIPKDDPPASYDWRDHNAVTPVKNQGSCGSCWAFSTTGNVEGQWAIKKGQLLSLSEQELVDCDKIDDGCEGGLPSNAYKEIMRLGGLETEKDYPYDGADEKCKFDKTEVDAKISGGLNISTNEDDMKAWLAKNGPISIGINANAMQFYMGGVSHPFSFLCSPDNLDHGVLIVGYGTQKGWFDEDNPYWIVKNSWGPDWGEKGYYLVYRGKGVCGLNKMPTSAIVN